MKKSAAILGILCLLLFSACRVTPPEGGGTPAPTDPIQTVPPTQESPAPSPDEETAPPGQTAPVPTPTETPKTLTTEELVDLTRAWSESRADRFAGYEVFALPKKYWFADHVGGVEYVSFTSADGQDGAIAFLANADGAVAPLDAAARLLEQPADDLLVADRAQLLESLERHMAALAGEGATEAVALERFYQAAGDTPALGEEMWYCVSAEKTGYLLMAHQGVYRLQPMAAMIEYAETPVFRARVDFDRAVEAGGWFATQPLSVNGNESIELDGTVYYRVNEPGLDSQAVLRTYLKTIFSDEVTDGLFRQAPGPQVTRFAEVDGALYAAPAEQAGLNTTHDYSVTVLQSGPSRVEVEVTFVLMDPDRDYITVGEETHIFPYEQVGDKWVFTEFYLVNQDVRQELPD